MANINTKQTWDFNSAQHNNAAKADDYNGGPITGADLLANDSGSASFYGLYDATTGQHLESALNFSAVYDPTVDLSGFISNHSQDTLYSVIRLGNGSYSMAELKLAHGLFVNDIETFTNNVNEPLQNGFVYKTLSAADGWQALQGSAPSEIIGPNYLQNVTGAYSGDNWLDTQATPGGIDIVKTFQVPSANAGALIRETLTITLAAESVPVGLQTDPNAKLDLYLNNAPVHEFALSDFTDPVTHQVVYNNFKTFTYDVTAVAGSPGLGNVELHDITPANLVGFAVDTIGLHSYIV